MTLEEQRQVMAASQQRLSAAMTAAQQDSGGGQLQCSASARVRKLPLGQDREGSIYWQLACAENVSGEDEMHPSMAV